MESTRRSANLFPPRASCILTDSLAARSVAASMTGRVIYIQLLSTGSSGMRISESQEGKCRSDRAGMSSNPRFSAYRPWSPTSWMPRLEGRTLPSTPFFSAVPRPLRSFPSEPKKCSRALYCAPAFFDDLTPQLTPILRTQKPGIWHDRDELDRCRDCRRRLRGSSNQRVRTHLGRSLCSRLTIALCLAHVQRSAVPCERLHRHARRS